MCRDLYVCHGVRVCVSVWLLTRDWCNDDEYVCTTRRLRRGTGNERIPRQLITKDEKWETFRSRRSDRSGIFSGSFLDHGVSAHEGIIAGSVDIVTRLITVIRARRPIAVDR